MKKPLACYKPLRTESGASDAPFRIAGVPYAQNTVTEEERAACARPLAEYYVERRYKTQVAGLGQVYYDMKSEISELTFEELILLDGECIGAFHAEHVFLFADERTHSVQKYLGEMPTSADQGIPFYEYYDLCRRRTDK